MASSGGDSGHFLKAGPTGAACGSDVQSKTRVRGCEDVGLRS